MKSLMVALLVEGKIETSEPKAKEIRPHVEKLVTKAKQNTLASRRLVAAKIGDGKATETLFADIAPKYKTRNGGYTRIVKLPRRMSDGSARAVIEFV